MNDIPATMRGTGIGAPVRRVEDKRFLRGQGRYVALADRVVSRYEALWKRLSISHDDFIRTTEARHESQVKLFVEKLLFITG